MTLFFLSPDLGQQVAIETASSPHLCGTISFCLSDTTMHVNIMPFKHPSDAHQPSCAVVRLVQLVTQPEILFALFIAEGPLNKNLSNVSVCYM